MTHRETVPLTKENFYLEYWDSGGRDREDVCLLILRDGVFEDAIEVYRAFSGKDGIVRDACLDFFASKGFTKAQGDRLIQLGPCSLRFLRDINHDVRRALMYHFYACPPGRSWMDEMVLNDEWFVRCRRELWGWPVIFTPRRYSGEPTPKVFCGFYLSGESRFMRIARVSDLEFAREDLPSLARDLTRILSASSTREYTTEEILDKILTKGDIEL